MSISTHLYRINQTYYFRVRIPKDVRQWFRGDDFKRSLKTKTLTHAKSLATLWLARTEKLFTILRTGMLTERQIHELVSEYYNETMNEIEESRSEGLFVPKDRGELESLQEDHQLTLSALREALAYNHISAIEHIATGLLEDNGVESEKGTSSYTKLCRGLLKAAIDITELELNHLRGDYSEDISKAKKYAVKKIPHEDTSNSSSMRLSNLIKLYIDEHVAQGRWSSKTHQETESGLELFLELLGDTDVSTITRETMVACLNNIKKLPARRHQLKEYRDKSIQELLALHPVPNPLGTLTIKKRMIAISSLFKWATQYGYMSNNPAEGLAPDDKRAPNEQRKAYPKETLQVLIDTLGKKNRPDLDRPDRWWIPVIGLFSGQRLDEICQLYKEDIRCIDGVWCFDVNDSGDKKLKNKSSRRIVPIHSQLIDLGFLEYHESVNHERLWPYLKKGANGYSHLYSRWFQKLNRNHITKSEGEVFHSLRHNFTNALKQAGIQEQIITELVGHSRGSITMERYGKLYEPKVLKEAVEKLDYGLDLSPLR